MIIRPSKTDIKRATQISVALDDVERYLSGLTIRGQAHSASTEVRYYYLGPNGEEAEERITRETILGQDDDNPRQAGYYAIDVISLHDEKSLAAKPWYCVWRDQSNNQWERREPKTAEAAFTDALEEHRFIISMHKREVQEQSRKNHALQVELDTFARAFNELRKQTMALEIERDQAIHDAVRMEHEKNLALRRCAELEEEASSFKPQIQQFVDGIAKSVGPQFQEMFMAVSGGAFGLDGDEEEGSPGTSGNPRPPWSGGGGGGGGSSNGAAASGARANGVHAKGVHAQDGDVIDVEAEVVQEGAGTNGQAKGRSNGTGTRKVSPQQQGQAASGMPKPEDLQQALFYLFWEHEKFGRAVHEHTKDEHGQPFVPWWVIRGIVYYYKGTDLGPTAIWPSDAAKEDAGGVARDTPSQGTPSRPPSAQARSTNDRARGPGGAVRSSGGSRGADAHSSSCETRVTREARDADVRAEEPPSRSSPSVDDAEIVEGPFEDERVDGEVMDDQPGDRGSSFSPGDPGVNDGSSLSDDDRDDRGDRDDGGDGGNERDVLDARDGDDRGGRDRHGDGGDERDDRGDRDDDGDGRGEDEDLHDRSTNDRDGGSYDGGDDGLPSRDEIERGNGDDGSPDGGSSDEEGS